MIRNNREQRRRIEALDAESLLRHQLARLNDLLDKILPTNRFYADKLGSIKRPVQSLDDLGALPFTFKEELVSSPKAGDLATNLTYSADQYSRFHQTSGTRGRPMVVLDTAEDWRWWIECWQYVLDAAEITPNERVLMAFSFGPFIGFWSAYDALSERGCLVIPGGGMSTLARLELCRTSGATALFCTPSYALHMAEVGAEHQIDVAALPVRQIVLAGEPGGSIPAIRTRLEQLWDARVLDHCGATEVGPWGYGDLQGRGLYVMESEFIAEFLSVKTGTPAAEGELAELVLTTLGRFGSPIIRYRTRDLVKPTWHHGGVNRFVLLEGGVLGRTDDMMIIRGMNVFPTSIEQILRSFPEVVEFRMTAYKTSAMDQLLIEVEDRLNQPERVANELRLRLGLKIEVQSVPLGSLPRFEGKGKRFVDKRMEKEPAGNQGA